MTQLSQYRRPTVNGEYLGTTPPRYFSAPILEQWSRTARGEDPSVFRGHGIPYDKPCVLSQGESRGGGVMRKRGAGLIKVA